MAPDVAVTAAVPPGSGFAATVPEERSKAAEAPADETGRVLSGATPEVIEVSCAGQHDLASRAISSDPIPGTAGLAVRGSLWFIRQYQWLLSPLIGRGCRFRPTCSRYTYTAIVRHGFWRGWLQGCLRILRCNPFCRGGDDPVR